MKPSSRLFIALCATGTLILAGCSSETDETSASTTTDAAATDATAETGGQCDATVAEDTETEDTEADADASEAALGTVTLSDDALSAPTVSFEAPLAVTAETSTVTDAGDGEVIEAGEIITFNYVVCDLVTGEKLYSTWGTSEDLDAPESYILSSSTFGEILTDTITGATVGTRVLWAQPGQSAEESYTGVATNGYLYALSLTDSLTLPDSASGTEVTPSDTTLPVVTIEDGVPAISVPDSFTEPEELIVQPLIEGEGDPVETGQTVAVKYSGWLTDGTQFDSSWPYEGSDSVFMFTVGSGGVIQGWEEGVLDVNVGSRVLLVIPSELGYGADGSGETIPADSTLIFVVDILAAF